MNGYAVSITPSAAHSSVLNFDAMTIPFQKVEESEKHQWREGHSLRWKERPDSCDCEVCFDLSEGGMFVCDGTSSLNYALMQTVD